MRWVRKLKLGDRRQLVVISEVRFLWTFVRIFIYHLSVDASFGLIFDPLSDEEFVFVVIEVRSLAFTMVFNPVTFKMIAVTFCQHTIAVAFAFMPLSFINIFISVDHAALSLWQTVDPIAVVSITVFVEKCASSVHFVLVPISSVFTPQLASLVSPVGALAVTLVISPHSFVFVAFFVMLNAESFFAVVFPIADVPRRGLPQLALNAAVFLALLFGNPIHASVSTLLLGL